MFRNACFASAFYKIVANTQYGKCDILRLIWQMDLKLNIDKDSWKSMVSSVGGLTRRAQEKLTCYKVLHCFSV